MKSCKIQTKEIQEDSNIEIKMMVSNEKAELTLGPSKAYK